MKKRDRTLALLLTLAMALALLSGCESMAQTPAAEAPTEAPAAEPAADAADLVLTNGTIQTMVSEDDTAEAVAVKNGEIVYVAGDEHPAEAAVCQRRVHGLRGAGGHRRGSGGL